MLIGVIDHYYYNQSIIYVTVVAIIHIESIHSLDAVILIIYAYILFAYRHILAYSHMYDVGDSQVDVVNVIHKYFMYNNHHEYDPFIFSFNVFHAILINIIN
jgi:hypothetical protein